MLMSSHRCLPLQSSKPPLQRCSDGHECTGSVDGGSPCTEGESWKRERCHGCWDDNTCVDSRHYCSGGRKVRCPEGTKCWESDDGGCPCKRHRPKPDGCSDECESDDWDKVRRLRGWLASVWVLAPGRPGPVVAGQHALLVSSVRPQSWCFSSCRLGVKLQQLVLARSEVAAAGAGLSAAATHALRLRNRLVRSSSLAVCCCRCFAPQVACPASTLTAALCALCCRTTPAPMATGSAPAKLLTARWLLLLCCLCNWSACCCIRQHKLQSSQESSRATIALPPGAALCGRLKRTRCTPRLPTASDGGAVSSWRQLGPSAHIALTALAFHSAILYPHPQPCCRAGAKSSAL